MVYLGQFGGDVPPFGDKEPHMTKVVDILKAQAALNRAAASKDHAGRFKLDDRRSSVIERVDYDDDSSELDILFITKKKYRYFGVPPEIYHGFVDAPSKGEFFNAHIRDRYEHSEVVPRR